MRYAVYEKNTGQIRTIISCPEDHIEQQLAVDGSCAYLRVDDLTVDDSTHYVVNEKLVEFPTRPSYGVWSWAEQTWVVDIDAAKEATWAALKEARDSAMYSGFIWDGSVFDSDQKSQVMIQGAVQLAQVSPDSFSVDWTLADNTIRILSKSDLISIGEELGNFIQSIYARGRVLRQIVESSNTIQELQSISW